VRLGVTAIDSNELRAHAWVEAVGVKLNEPQDPAGQAIPFVTADQPAR
jgi:hypothetical protein